MATGDLKRNLDRVLQVLTSAKYTGQVDTIGLQTGMPSAHLPLLHFAVVDYSGVLSRYAFDKGYALVAKTDKRFVESLFRFLREELDYRPQLTLVQFFSTGFAERKLILLFDVIKLCMTKHEALMKQARASIKSTDPPRLYHPRQLPKHSQEANTMAEKNPNDQRVLTREPQTRATGKAWQSEQIAPEPEAYQQQSESEDPGDDVSRRWEYLREYEQQLEAEQMQLRDQQDLLMTQTMSQRDPSFKSEDLEAVRRAKSPHSHHEKYHSNISAETDPRPTRIVGTLQMSELYTLVEYIVSLEEKLSTALQGLCSRLESIDTRLSNCEWAYSLATATYNQVLRSFHSFEITSKTNQIARRFSFFALGESNIKF
ncbi:Centrosomal protein of 44 kDa [Pelomyxa schiedti]|nr:Centrosomal protein of 44 kDa [Pelomyxa schiedti]